MKTIMQNSHVHSCLPSRLFSLWVFLQANRCVVPAFCLSTEKEHSSPPHSSSIVVVFHIKAKLPKPTETAHKWLSLLCLLFLSPTESGWPKSSCDAGANDNFSVFISFFSHQHLVPFSSRLKSPFSCFYTSRCPLVGPLISLATSFSARSLKFGGSLHAVRAVSLISIPSVGGSHLDL